MDPADRTENGVTLFYQLNTLTTTEGQVSDWKASCGPGLREEAKSLKTVR